MEQVLLKNEVPDPVVALAGGIAHDFNNLLSAIKGRVSLMMQRIRPNDPLFPQIVQIINSIDKGSEITKKLMEIASDDDYCTRFIDVNEIVQNTIEHFEFGKNIILDVDIDRDPLIIKADPDKIRQVLINIIKNAIQAMPDGGKMSIMTEATIVLNGSAEFFGLEPGSFVKITVEDSGIGMEKHVLENIFNPFFTYPPELCPEKKGLGLSLARDIIQNHDGIIEVWSTPNIGSSFSIILPANGMKKN
jgi:signal transduction histidine kinase